MNNVPERANTVHPGNLRASDADRDGVAELLRQAAGDGRLGLDELDDRLGAVYAAKTYAELEPITGDLGTGTAGPRGRSTAGVGGTATARIGGTPTSRLAVGIMSGFRRGGAWIVPERFTALALWGGGKLDLREARFAGAQVRIRVFALWGGIAVVVPDDLDVRVNGIGFMGAFSHKATGPGAPGAPRVIISGLALWGGVGTRRSSRRRSNDQLTE